MTLLDGINTRLIVTDRRQVNILERTGDTPATTLAQTIVLIQNDELSSVFWQQLMQDLPSDLRVLSIGVTVDAAHDVRERSDDLHAALAALEVPTAHLVGWSADGAVALHYALDHPALSLTVAAPTNGGGVAAGALGELTVTPPVLWVHDAADGTAATDASFEAYRARGGALQELTIDGVGETPHLERPAAFRSALLELIGYIGHPADPAPPTEAIILSSSD